MSGNLHFVASVLGASVLMLGNRVQAAQPPAVPKAVCPVMAKPVKQDVSIDYKGGKLYFCCSGCIEKFRADTAKYAPYANYQLAVTGQAKQVACPFTGRALNPNIPPETVGELSILFCCHGCKNTVARTDPKNRIRLVFGEPFDTTFVMKKTGEIKKSENR